MYVRNALRAAVPRLQTAPMHSHTVKFAGAKGTYNYSTVDFFDSTCPICKAVKKGRQPVCEFVQPIPGVQSTYVGLGFRLRRWAFNVLVEFFGQWPIWRSI